jgi:competence protein ComEC
MEERVWRARLMSVTVLTILSLGIWGSLSTKAEVSSPVLEVSFLDVGQGDATLIQTVSGTQVLIDGGAHAGVLRELAAQLPLFDGDIDLVVATHPDTDHVGGLVDVLERYDVQHILMTENQGDSPAAKSFQEAVTHEGASVTMARRGQLWQLDASTTLEVLFPETDPTQMESNASSIILRLTYGSHSFLFTGDAPKRIEEYLVLAEGENLQSNVLKVGHHGSRTSTSELFLAEVSPQYAVISYGADNRYGHPHVEVTDLLFNEGVEILETARAGAITFESDGTVLKVK